MALLQFFYQITKSTERRDLRKKKSCKPCEFTGFIVCLKSVGVTDGARTHDIQNHNLTL